MRYVNVWGRRSFSVSNLQPGRWFVRATTHI